MIQNVAEIVAAFVRKKAVSAPDLPTLIASVSQSLATLGKAPVAAPPAPLTPVVSIRASIRPDHIVCLGCGKKQKLLKRHISAAHGMTADQYRVAWNLAATYPMVAPAYAAKRSALAKSLGLGHNRKK